MCSIKRKFTAGCILFSGLLWGCAWASESGDKVRAHLENLAPHPRLLMAAGDETRIREEVATHMVQGALNRETSVNIGQSL